MQPRIPFEACQSVPYFGVKPELVGEEDLKWVTYSAYARDKMK